MSGFNSKKRTRPTTGSRSGTSQTTGTRTTGTRTTHGGTATGTTSYPGITPTTIVDDFNNYTDNPHDFTRDENGNFTETAAWADLLNALQGGANGQDAIAQLLLTMSQNGNFTPEIRDQIRTFLLQMISNQDQRQFDISQLQDSRLYNSPTNELARMMGAGISRDAAIQMLSGSAGNIGGVAGSMGAAAPNVPQTSGTMDLQQKQFAVGTAQSAVAMLGQLIDSGLSLAQGVESVKAMQSANYFTQAQMQGFSSANELVNALETMQISGQLESSEIEKLSNGNDLVKYLNKIAPNNEAVKQLLGSNAYKGTFGSIYGRDFFNNYWDSVRKTRDSGTIADEFIQQQRLNNALTNVNINKVGAEMELIGSQKDEIEQRIIESTHNVAKIDAEIEVLNANGEWIKVQTKNYGRYIDSVINQNDANAYLANTEAGLVGAQTVGQNIQNDINRDIFEINHAGFPMMKEAHLHECERELERVRFLNRPSERAKELAAWAKERDNAVKLAYLNELYYNAAGKFASQYPNLWELCVGFNAAGAGDVVRSANSVANGAGVGAAAKFVKFMPK